MENGDISDWLEPRLACIFEGLLALPPSKLMDRWKTALNKDDWDNNLKRWTPQDVPVKSISDFENRLGVSTLVITFLSPDAPDAIYRWLRRKGVSPVVEYYEDLDQFAQDLKFNRGIHTVFVPDQDMAFTLGIRAQVVTPTTPWR